MKYNLIAFLIVSSLSVSSCSHSSNELYVDNFECFDSDNFHTCMNEFEMKFSAEVEKLKGIKTRSADTKIENNEEYDLYLDSIGDGIIAGLLPVSTQLMDEVGLSEADFKEIEDEYDISSDFMKVYFSLGVMEEINFRTSKANAEDVVSCVILGAGYKELIAGGAN